MFYVTPVFKIKRGKREGFGPINVTFKIHICQPFKSHLLNRTPALALTNLHSSRAYFICIHVVLRTNGDDSLILQFNTFI
jgi:hypothetical protein